MMVQLKLFIAGDTELSRRASANLERVCTQTLAGQCDTEVVDILQGGDAAREYRVIATPVVIRTDVSPYLKVLGDLSDEQRLIAALNMMHLSTGQRSDH